MEIKQNILPGQSAQDRPDIETRVFNARLKNICKHLYTDGIFGGVAARTHFIEFQKIGLPHAHILVILDPSHIPRTTEEIDLIVSAEIPNKPLNLTFTKLYQDT